MSDLIRRLCKLHMQCDGRSLYAVAADRIEADEALLRQALEALVWEAGSEPALYAAQTYAAIAAIRKRLNGQAEET